MPTKKTTPVHRIPRIMGRSSSARTEAASPVCVSSHQTVTSTRRHPAHPDSVRAEYPSYREKALWPQDHDEEILQQYIKKWAFVVVQQLCDVPRE